MIPHFEQIPCHSAYTRRPRAPRLFGQAVIIHYTAPPLWTAERYALGLQQSPEQRTKRWSAHGIIDSTGSGVQCAPLDVETSHAGKGKLFGRSPNSIAFGFEIVNAGWASHPKAQSVTARHRNPRSKSTQWHLFTEESIKALATAISHCATRRPDTSRPLYVAGHEDVTHYQIPGVAGSKVDPGPAFPWGLLMFLLVDDPVERLQWNFNTRRLEHRDGSEARL